MTPEVLADDGFYKLCFVSSRKKYVAGCRRFTCAEAIEHWGARAKGKCNCSPGCTYVPDESEQKRARLFLKAIKAHNSAQPSPQQVYRDVVEGTATEPGAEV